MAKQIKNAPLENDSLQVVESKKAPKQVFTLENLNPALLPELASFKEKQLQVVKDNPFVKITDTASRELAKKHRTARVTARTTLTKQKPIITSKFAEAKNKAFEYIDELVAITLTGETEQQTEIDRDEAVLEEKRNEKARLEKERIDNIKAELDKYSDEWKDAFNLMTFQTIEKIGDDFVESYSTYDTAILEEFESLFPTKVEELTAVLADKVKLLTEAENARIEKEQKDLELKRTRELIATGFSFDGNNYFVSDFKRLDMGTILRLSDEDFQSILQAGKTELDRLAKIESDRLEKLEEEKEAIYEIRKNRLLELGLKYSDEHDTIYVDADSDFIILCSDIKEESAIEFENTIAESKQAFQDFNAEPIPEVIEAVIIVDGNSTSENIPTVSPEMHKGVESEEKALEILQTIDSSVPENTTVNVCKPFEQAIKETAEAVPAPLAETPLTPKDCIAPPTWDSIAEDFKSSGEKSYSLWLKNNYNVPTKIQ